MDSLGSRIVGYCPIYIQCSCGHANVYNIFQKQDPWVKVYDNVMTLSMYCQIASPWGSSHHILFSFYICACWNSDKYSRGFSVDPWGSLSSVRLSSLESFPTNSSHGGLFRLRPLPFQLSRTKGLCFGFFLFVLHTAWKLPLGRNLA